MPEIVKPGTAASAAVPRLVATPRRAKAILEAVSGEITCLTSVGRRTLNGFP